jgi:hypothetical protein
MTVVSLLAIRTGHLYPAGNIPGTHFCYEAESTIVQPEGRCEEDIKKDLASKVVRHRATFKWLRIRYCGGILTGRQLKFGTARMHI